MTEEEINTASADIQDCVKAFLTYCPDGSEKSSTRSAMDYIKAKFEKISDSEYRKLCDTARAVFSDITKTPLKRYTPQRRFQGKRK